MTQLEASRLDVRLVPMVRGLAGATWLVSRDWECVAAAWRTRFSWRARRAERCGSRSAPGCGTSCGKCDPASAVVYAWVGDVPACRGRRLPALAL